MGRILATMLLPPTAEGKTHYCVKTIGVADFDYFAIDDKNYRVETVDHGDLQVISANRSTPEKP